MATPGASVSSGALISPGGAQGPTGPTGATGATGSPGPSTPSANTGNLLTTGSDSLLYLPPSAIQPTITSVRLRSWNAVGNPGFTVDQRFVGAGVANPATGTLVIDRWRQGKAGTMAGTFQQLAANTVVPGTNFYITNRYLWINLTTQQASLGATDVWQIVQVIEGPQLLELFGDVHSVSILCQTNVSGGLKFGLTIRDAPTTTKCLTKLCTIPSSGTSTLITLPNLPVFASGGNWNTAPGNTGYELVICLAAGTTNTTPANDTWQNGSTFTGAVGQDNFASKPINSSLALQFIQHSPGSNVDLIDKSFIQNLTECQRYFAKSYNYTVAPGTASNPGCVNTVFAAGQNPLIPVRFPVTMAKTPTTLNGYSTNTGAVTNVRDGSANADKAISGTAVLGDSGFSGFTITSPNASAWNGSFHYTADTGW